MMAITIFISATLRAVSKADELPQKGDTIGRDDEATLQGSCQLAKARAEMMRSRKLRICWANAGFYGGGAAKMTQKQKRRGRTRPKQCQFCDNG
ncbi:MAG: hypothetical protein K2P80_09180 [Beijerinckiaceae bacterium]|nr:hypothetical protein [Beijerinckiaceae bacterium]